MSVYQLNVCCLIIQCICYELYLCLLNLVIVDVLIVILIISFILLKTQEHVFGLLNYSFQDGNDVNDHSFLEYDLPFSLSPHVRSLYGNQYFNVHSYVISSRLQCFSLSHCGYVKPLHLLFIQLNGV